jgi:Fe-S oxidoreductase
VGKCLADNTATGGVMCPSFQATRDEKDSTRGRARVLQDLVSGRLEGGWQSDAVQESLDLCLACKGCAHDCPTGVDMATYKAETLQRRYAGRRRPLTHYTLGRLPALVGLAPPALANLGLRVAPGLAKAAAGVDRRRSLPSLARRPASRRSLGAGSGVVDAVLWVDTFTNRFSPDVAEAALEVLESSGARVGVVALDDECCGLTWMSTGQLDQARSRLGSLLARLDARVPEGVPVVALEPSCLAVVRDDSENLLAERPAVADRVLTLAEHLTAVGWQPPDLTGTEVVAQPHCHHASVLGWQADEALLQRAGARITRVGGCCGLAGNFGMEKGHYEVSVAVYEHDLGPAVRSRPDAVVLADGFSCRTQLADLGGRESVHLAQLLASRL